MQLKKNQAHEIHFLTLYIKEPLVWFAFAQRGGAVIPQNRRSFWHRINRNNILCVRSDSGLVIVYDIAWNIQILIIPFAD